MRERLKLIGPRCVSSEAEYLALWKKCAQADLSPQNLALTGGLLADRMSWAFIAAYQAAISWCFANSHRVQGRNEWFAFASSEDRQVKEPLPGVTGVIAQNSFVLSGNKTWVAACDSIESLIVKVGKGGSSSYWYVPRNTQGLSINSYPAPKRLPDLSQGAAAFDNLELPMSFALDSSRVSFFHAAEAYHLLVALTASLWSQSTHYNFTDISDDCLPLLIDLEELGLGLQEKTFKLRFSKVHESVLDTLKFYIDRADRSQSELWQRDIQILMMYLNI